MGAPRYEGTGRSLSIKLLQQLRADSAKTGNEEEVAVRGGLGRSFREVQLKEPIR